MSLWKANFFNLTKQTSDRWCSAAAHNILTVPKGHSTPSNRRNKQNQQQTECLLPLCGRVCPRLAELRIWCVCLCLRMSLCEVKSDECGLMLISFSRQQHRRLTPLTDFWQKITFLFLWCDWLWKEERQSSVEECSLTVDRQPEIASVIVCIGLDE